MKIRAIRFRRPKTSKEQVFAVVGVHLMLFSTLSSMPLIEWFTARHYKLDAQTLSLVGEASPKLAHKLTYNKEKALYEYNADEIKRESDDPADVAKRLQRNMTGENADKSTYSLELSTDTAQGMTIYDNNSGISFKMVPEFTTMPGRKEQDRLVYPMQDGSKAIYTIKNNGLKEDIVYQTAPKGGEVTLSYKLELPESLEAKLTSNGSVGFYAADPLLFGEISFGSDADQEKIESARKNAPKDHLVFAIPAPVIVAADGGIGRAQAKFTLTDDTLSVVSTELDTIKGAFSIDPTVVVTSTSDFTTGNIGNNIDLASNEIKRASLSGGETATWTSSTSMTQNRSDAKAVAYNGYLYILGGSVAPGFTTDLNTVIYAPINATTGALGAWTESPNAFANARYFHAATVYNGYIYVSGGRNGAGTRYNDVQYSKINTDGSIGTWTATTVLPGNRTGGGLLALNNYLYFLGGYDGTTYYATSHYAPIRADGTIGSWTASTSFTTGRYNFGITHYNDYIYIMGGTISGGSTATVYYTKTKADGTLETWQAGTSTIQTITAAPLVALNGYLYTYGGLGPSNGTLATTAYAPINANGSIGSWKQATNTYITPRVSHVGVAYNGRLYLAGGNSTASYTPNNDSQYVSISPAGVTTSYSTTTSMPIFSSQGKQYGRSGHTSAVYNGYIYVIGGERKAAAVATIDYAPINSNGTIGTWAATTALTAARTNHTSLVYNGYLYVIGGSITNTVQYAPINSNGTIGTWAATTSFTGVRSSHTTVEYNGYVYILGGTAGSTLNDVQYALICTGANNGIGGCGATAGTVGTWTTTTSFSQSRYGHSSVAYNGYVYVMGGNDSVTTYSDVQYALICTGANNGIGGCGATAGTVGTWTTTTSFTALNPRLKASAVVYNGNLYLVGGTNSGVSTNQVIYAPFSANGTVGAWQANASLLTARDSNTAVVHNGYMYTLGGFDGTAIERADVEYALINNGGAGTAGTWATTTAFATGRQTQSTVVYNGYMYILGGNNGPSYYDDVQYAPINANGTLGTWTATTSFTTGRYEQTAVAYNGYMYLIGGYGGGNLADVQYAPINANGTLGTWVATTSLPAARYGHTSFAQNGYIYAIGGYGATELNDVQYAPINANGTLGTWTATSSFTTARYQHSSVAYNGYVYIMGGSGEKKDVQYAPINANGTLGTWNTTSGFAVGRHSHSSTVYNGYLYLMGGYGGAAYRNDVQYAPINANGTLGDWNTTQSFTTTRSGTDSVAHEGFLYLLGGYTGGTNTFLNDVQYATLQTIPRKARYSKLIDLGSVVTVNSITSNGSGTRNVFYQTAGSDGIFGTQQPAGSTGGVSARYVWVKVDLDDTATSVTGATFSSVTDVTVDYSAGAATCAPAQRLRHGAYFSSEALQAFNTCLP